MRKKQKRQKHVSSVKRVNRSKQIEDKKKTVLSQLSEKERDIYTRIRDSLIANDFGIAASVARHPVTKLWQGWISDGSALVFISARKDIEKAYADVEELLDLVARDDSSLEDIFSLWGKLNSEDDLPPEPLPEHASKGLLYFIRLIYALDEC
jgi:HrpA-like RNA helicase